MRVGPLGAYTGVGHELALRFRYQSRSIEAVKAAGVPDNVILAMVQAPQK